MRDIVRSSRLMVFLDYDGTLSPIAATPGDAVLPKAAKVLLSALSQLSGCAVVVISGRRLKDLKQQCVGLKRIAYAGNHGLEIAGADIGRWDFKGFKKDLRDLKAQIRKAVALFQGAFLEDKGLTLSLHYRLVAAQDIPAVKTAIDLVTRPLRLQRKIRIIPGKKVFDIRPPWNWDKGKAVAWFLARQREIWKTKEILAVYLGDDTTDENAFRALKNQGMTVVVGKKQGSSARYYLKDPGEVTQFLQRLWEGRRHDKPRNGKKRI